MAHPMTLHTTPDFADALLATAQALKLPEAFVEKDYWVTTVLRALSDSSYRESIVFKGGTALSKAYGLVQRFSEDVDLALTDDETRTNSKTKSLMDKGAKHVTQGLPEVEDAATSRGSRFRRTVHQYESVLESPLFAQVRHGQILVEVNAFAHPHPSQWMPVQSYVGQFLETRGEHELVAEHGLEPFEVQVLSLERTLTEKVLALVRAGYHPNAVGELRAKIRHVYDLYYLLEQESLQGFFDGASFDELIKAVQGDDARNSEFQGEWAEKPLAESALFAEPIQLWPELQITYRTDFRAMVYGPMPPEDAVVTMLERVSQRLKALLT
jgi:predicted nucleotidyltransferase component of viral defense system